MDERDKIALGEGLRIPEPELLVDSNLSAERSEVREGYLAKWASTSPGDQTRRARVILEESEEHKLILEVEGLPSSYYFADLVRTNAFVPKISNASIGMSSAALRDASVPILLSVHFPPGVGWKTITVTLTW